jgi:type I restriction-modification system DNA methylase subunit
MERFEDADKRYNSGLFDFRKDTVTPSLKIDDKLLSDILSELYPPKSSYEFSVIGIEILGEVYEQFLDKVIRLTAGHQAKVEEKPEVREAGGVHYTPQYIVNYIVKNTVGKPPEGGTPARLTFARRRPKMRPMSAQGRPALTGT